MSGRLAVDACQTVMFTYALDQWECSGGGVAFFWRKEAKQSFILLTGRLFGQPGQRRRRHETVHLDLGKTSRRERERNEHFLPTRDNLDKCIDSQQVALKSRKSRFSFFSRRSPCLKNMDSKYILEKSSAGPRLGVADFNCRPGRSVLRDARVSTLDGRGYLYGPVSCKFSPAEVIGVRTPLKGSGPSAGGRLLHDTEKVSAPPTVCLRDRAGETDPEITCSRPRL